MHKIISVAQSILAVFIGLMVISLVTEVIEFSVITALHGSVTTDSNIYFEIRNRLPVILLKFVYNGVAAFLGGYVTAWIADRRQIGHGIALASIQAISLIWGMSSSSFSHSTPPWVWMMLILLMPPAIVIGAKWRRNRKQGIS